MQLTVGAVRQIAECARIKLQDVEIESMTQDLNDIIESLEPITQFDLEGVEPTFHPIAGLCNVMREDIEEPGFSQEEATKNAPAVKDGQYKIPPILSDGGGDR